MNLHRRTYHVHRLTPFLRATALVLLTAAWAGAQTKITAPPNKYTPEQDVQLGEKAAQQVEQQMPRVSNKQVDAYVESIGRRLVAAIPPQFQHSQFH